MAWTRFGKKKDMPGGLWIKCESCGAMLFRKEFEQRHRVCQTCGYHFTLPARERVALTADPNSFVELWSELGAYDALEFHDRVPYGEKLVQTRKKTGENDAMVTGEASIKGIPCALGVMNFQFLGGSMGMVVGEKIALLCEHALQKKLPVILFACSGGARMHEGAVSLMQMAKTCGALQRLHHAGGVSISVMTHPQGPGPVIHAVAWYDGVPTVLGGQQQTALGRAINNPGLVVGHDGDYVHVNPPGIATAWDGDDVVALAYPGAANGVNNAGQIAGYVGLNAGESKAAYWRDRDAAPVIYPPLEGDTAAWFRDITNPGLLVGFSQGAKGSTAVIARR